MKYFYLFICLFLYSVLHAEVNVVKQNQFVILQNDCLKIEYDLAKGVYHGVKINDPTSNFKDAKLRINDLSSDSPTFLHSYTYERVKDELGQGIMLQISSIDKLKPEIILQITLYDNKDFIVLSGGIKNTLFKEFIVNEIDPLSDAKFFNGVTNKFDFKILNGPGGAGYHNGIGAETRVHKKSRMMSPNNILATFISGRNRKSLVLGGLTYEDYSKYATVTEQKKFISANILCWDSIGKRVDPNVVYLPKDKCYVDFCTDNQFDALEKYGLNIRTAQQVKLSLHNFPTVDGWYVAVFSKGGKEPNNTQGMISIMDAVNKTGFQNYSKVAVRLVPDDYSQNNEQCWWDDEHWQKYGHYVRPYETTKKWAEAVIKRGGIPLIYSQTSNTSRDFVKQYPNSFLFNDTSLLFTPDNKNWSYKSSVDFTDKIFVNHLIRVYENLRDGGVCGLMFDYPESSFRNDRGCFDDPYATGASVYRSIFKWPKKILGPGSYIDERNIWSQSSGKGCFMDVTVGLVDNQRVWGDTDIATPEMYSRCGHRWYKNRVIYTYDMDSKNLYKVSPMNRDGLRQLLTMVYIVAPRLVLATSFSSMTNEQIYDLERIYPMHEIPKSARPLDAFDSEDGIPHVYDFEVNKDWHQLAFYNSDTLNTKTISVEISKPTSFGGMGLLKDQEYYIYDFWNDHFIGKIKGDNKIVQKLRRGEVRMMSIHKVEPIPQFISTNRHVMQGFLDMKKCEWDASNLRLHGASEVVAGETYRVVIAMNNYKVIGCNSDDAIIRIDYSRQNEGLIELLINKNENGIVDWEIDFFKK